MKLDTPAFVLHDHFAVDGAPTPAFSARRAPAMPLNFAVQSRPSRVQELDPVSVDTGLQAIAVELDLMDPFGARRRRCRQWSRGWAPGRPARGPSGPPRRGTAWQPAWPFPRARLAAPRDRPGLAGGGESRSFVSPDRIDACLDLLISGAHRALGRTRRRPSAAAIAPLFSCGRWRMRTRCQRPLDARRAVRNRGGPSRSPSGIRLGRPVPLIPDDHRAAAVLAFRDHALENEILDRMVFGVHREALLAGDEARSPA